MSDFKNKVVITTIDELNKFEAQNFPDGIKAKRKRDFFNDGAYIGFNLNRFAYTDLLAAECHALRDRILGYSGSSYGFPFEPYVETHTDDNGEQWFEVYTG